MCAAVLMLVLTAAFALRVAAQALQFARAAVDHTAALEKALDVLDAVGASPSGLSQTELGARLDLPRTTLYRLLGALVQDGIELDRGRHAGRVQRAQMAAQVALAQRVVEPVAARRGVHRGGVVEGRAVLGHVERRVAGLDPDAASIGDNILRADRGGRKRLRFIDSDMNGAGASGWRRHGAVARGKLG